MECRLPTEEGDIPDAVKPFILNTRLESTRIHPSPILRLPEVAELTAGVTRPGDAQSEPFRTKGWNWEVVDSGFHPAFQDSDSVLREGTRQAFEPTPGVPALHGTYS